MSIVPPRRSHVVTSWHELESGGPPDQPGVTVCRFFVGTDEDDDGRPAVLKVHFPAGTEVAAHTHDTDYAEVILQGSQQVTRRWYREGDIRIVKAGTVYGPLVAGPEGATVLFIFKDSRWMPSASRTSVIARLEGDAHATSDPDNERRDRA